MIQEENRIRNKVYGDLTKKFELKNKWTKKQNKKDKILIKYLEDTILSLRK
jgi:hypothetical protein